MFQIIEIFIGILENFKFFAGILLGLLLDGIITGVVSYFVWGTFNSNLFLILFIPCAVVALFWLMKIEKSLK